MRENILLRYVGFGALSVLERELEREVLAPCLLLVRADLENDLVLVVDVVRGRAVVVFRVAEERRQLPFCTKTTPRETQAPRASEPGIR